MRYSERVCKTIYYTISKNGEVLTAELDEAAKAARISRNTLNRAKTDLSKNGIIKFRNEGFGRSKAFYSRIEN